MLNTKLRKFLRGHPEIFNECQQGSSFISDIDIPDISWFYKRNDHLIEQCQPRQSKAAKPWYLHKRVLIPFCTVLVLGVFISFSTQGRAIAERLFSTVVNWVSGDQIQIQHGAHQPNAFDAHPEIAALVEEDLQYEVIGSYSSIDDANTAHGLNLAKSTIGDMTSVDVAVIDNQYDITSQYRIDDIGTVWVFQQVFLENFGAGSVSNSNIEVETLDGIPVYGSYSDNFGYATIFKDFTVIMIRSENITRDMFISFLENFEVVPQ